MRRAHVAHSTRDRFRGHSQNGGNLHLPQQAAAVQTFGRNACLYAQYLEQSVYLAGDRGRRLELHGFGMATHQRLGNGLQGPVKRGIVAVQDLGRYRRQSARTVLFISHTPLWQQDVVTWQCQVQKKPVLAPDINQIDAQHTAEHMHQDFLARCMQLLSSLKAAILHR